MNAELNEVHEQLQDSQLSLSPWYFKSLPPGVDASGCVEHVGLRLLYVGISPQERTPPRVPSQETLRKRIRYHYRGNAEGSTPT